MPEPKTETKAPHGLTEAGPRHLRPRLSPLVGRGEELGLIRGMLSGLAEGTSAVLQLIGEPGIGKSRLLFETLEDAHGRNYQGLLGRATELEPFSLAVDAFDTHLACRHGDLAQDLGELHARELAAVLPSLRTASDDGALPNERYRVSWAVGALIERLAAERPLVLAFDDLQWADAESRELVLHLARRPPAAPVLLVLASRPHEFARQVIAALRATRSTAWESVELAPLSESESYELLSSKLPVDVKPRIYQEGGGNPFYLEQLARAGEDVEGALPTSGASEVPHEVAAAIDQELGRLSVDSKTALQGAAVAGDPFEVELLVEATNLSHQQVLKALDDLAERDLIRGAEPRKEPLRRLEVNPVKDNLMRVGPRHFRFRHPIVHRAVYQSAGEGWRLDAHKRIAAALRRRGSAVTDCARHVERSASVGDHEAVTLLEQAGHKLLSRAPATAARWFQASLRLLPEREEKRRLQLLVPLAMALGTAGQLQASRNALQNLLELEVLGTEPLLRTKTLAFAATIEHLLGNHQQADALLREPLAKLTATAVDVNAEAADTAVDVNELRIQQAYGCFFNAEWDDMGESARQVLDSTIPDDPTLQAAALSVLALADYGRADAKAARRTVPRAAEVVDALSDGELAGRLEAICWLGWAEFCLGQLDAAVRHMERGIQISRDTKQGHLVIPMRIVYALALLFQGDIEAAAHLADEAAQASDLSGNNLFLSWAWTIRCMAATQIGDLRVALGFGREGQAAGAKSGSRWSSVADCYTAEAWLEAGHPDCCEELLVHDGVASLPPFPFYESHCYELLTRAALLLDRHQAADRWSNEAARVARALGLPGPDADAKRAKAAVLLAKGELQRAGEEALAAASVAERAGLRLPAARARVLAGTALAQAGHRARAVSQLELASSEFAALGASRYRDHARRMLREVRSHGEGDASIGWLSDREREVAERVAEGMTNRRIAEDLLLSDKTIANYLSRIFTKLGVSSRAEVAASVERTRRESV